MSLLGNIKDKIIQWFIEQTRTNIGIIGFKERIVPTNSRTRIKIKP